MQPTSFSRLARAAAAAAFLTATVSPVPAAAKPRPGKPRAMNLFASAVAVMNVNRLLCPITNTGEVCVDSTLSPVLEGAFWPKGTPDSYIFNSGLQLGGVIPTSAGFAWAGDTVGAFFMDPRGDQAEGEGLTQIYNSLTPVDAAPGAWPYSAFVYDPALFNSVLINLAAGGRARGDGTGLAVSQEDLWVRVWDGNPAFTGSARVHPMGILVEERGMAWTYPTGNEDIIYFIYTFYNVSASNCAKYQNATVGNGDAIIQQEICQIGKNFQTINSARYGITIPPDGYEITSLWAAFFEDADVGDASVNYSNTNLAFNLGFAYKSDFLEPKWAFPPEAFSPPPLVPAPGFTAVKYLKSPVDPSTGQEIGLTLFSNTLNSAIGYPDPVGVHQLYRYLSGTNPATGDNPCSLLGVGGTPVQRHWCFLFQQPVDTRFFMSSGPFTLPAGEGRTIVVAYLQAAPTNVVLPFVGGDLKPGFPASPAGLLMSDSVRVIDSATGWVSVADTNPFDGKVEQNEVKTVPGSLLNKALVAQAVFDAKFLLPFAPAAPNFFLVPGDNQVTVVWQPSATEDPVTGGDPFYAVASDPTSPLYDPNFRKFDVEGYRIYRGRTKGDLKLVAQFDYAGTSMTDFTGTFAYPGKCAPELGVQTDCPTTFPSAAGVVHPLAGDIVQVPKGGRVELADGSILLLKADTALTGIGAKQGAPQCVGNPACDLKDTGVSFAYVDRGVRNSFTYFYEVEAFDVNSVISGPTSLQSSQPAKPVTPRASSGQEVAGQLSPMTLLGGGGQTLNPNATPPTLNATTGEFSGAAPPTNGLSLGLAVFLPQLLVPGSVSLKIDSVASGFSDPAGFGNAEPARYYMTGQGAGAPVHFVATVPVDGFDADNTNTTPFPATAVDSAQSARYGGNKSFSLFGSATLSVPGTWRTESWGRASINGDPANSDENGPRWWTGATNENTPNPNSKVCEPAAGACTRVDTLPGFLSGNAGSLPTVGIFHPQSYSTVPNRPQRDLEGMLSTVYRVADFTVYWGSTAGKVDSVVDVTHHVLVPYSNKVMASWGILNDSSFVLGGTPAASTRDANNGLLTWSDIYCVNPAPKFVLNAPCGGDTTKAALLMDHARLSPIAMVAATYAGTSALTATGNGFIFYINGHYFLMQTTTLPSSTTWNVRFYAGNITGTTAAGDFAFQPADFRPPAVPGLRAQVAYTGSTFSPKVTNDSVLARVHTVPDPYYVTNALEVTANTKVLKFVNLPAQCVIRIYSVSGILIRVLTHNDPTGGAEETWNLRNRNNQFVASGVYFYHVETADGKTKLGRFTVVNFAP